MPAKWFRPFELNRNKVVYMYICYVFNPNEIWKAVEWHTFVLRVAALFIRVNMKLGRIRKYEARNRAEGWQIAGKKYSKKKHSFRLELCAPAAYNFQVDNMQINSFLAHANGINDNSNANWNDLLLLFSLFISTDLLCACRIIEENAGRSVTAFENLAQLPCYTKQIVEFYTAHQRYMLAEFYKIHSLYGINVQMRCFHFTLSRFFLFDERSLQFTLTFITPFDHIILDIFDIRIKQLFAVCDQWQNIKWRWRWCWAKCSALLQSVFIDIPQRNAASKHCSKHFFLLVVSQVLQFGYFNLSLFSYISMKLPLSQRPSPLLPSTPF